MKVEKMSLPVSGAYYRNADRQFFGTPMPLSVTTITKVLI